MKLLDECIILWWKTALISSIIGLKASYIWLKESLVVKILFLIDIMLSWLKKMIINYEKEGLFSKRFCLLYSYQF
jgi:hypothetical protein